MTAPDPRAVLAEARRWIDANAPDASWGDADALLARIDAALAGMGWQPIATAPRDGTWIIGWFARDFSPYRISWGRNHRDVLTWCTSFGSFLDGYITHWMPLPEPPGAEGK